MKKIVRTYSAGVFFANVESRNEEEAVLTDARRLWYWKGAASLSEMAVRGVKYPTECKFPVAVPRIEVTEVVEILDCTPEAIANLEAVPEWRA